MITILVVIFIFITSLVIWALYGKGEGAIKVPDEKPEEKSLRRRATDKGIEEESTGTEEDLSSGKEDIEEIEEMGKVEDDFNLPYLADEIIPEGSKYWVYNRTLVNSEIYAKKGDFPTAISLYRGVYERIIDQEINAKIKANVDYLQEYQKLQLQRKTEELKQKALEKKGSEIRLSLDGPLKIPEKIQIALSSPIQRQDEPGSQFDINKIVDSVVEKITAKQTADSKKQEEIEKYRTEISDLKENIAVLMKSRQYADSAEIESIDSEIRELKEKSEELSELKQGLLKLHDRMIDMQNEDAEIKKGISEMRSKISSSIEKAGKELSLTEAGFQASSGTVDQDRIPVEEVDRGPSVAVAKFQASMDSLQGKIPVEEAPSSKKIDLKKEIQEEEPEEIEVLSQFEKEEEFARLSDEDIFEKILKDDLQKKKDDSFEIIGYNNRPKDDTYDIIDKEQEEKQMEEERFYRRFLRHGRRVRKELPILKVSYDFSKLPDEFTLSKDQNILQYSFYKYKPMLEKANELIKRRNVRDAINYYNVVKDQNIPSEFKVMLNKNITELTEYIEKYLTAD